MTGEKMKASYLKSKLDDNRLDLSLTELTNVPVKEILDLKKVTELDLSRNLLEYLPKDFCSLVTLTELDLSSNRLRALPEKFGNLVLLQRLDLYRNNITDIPSSFSRLKQLRWLDMKDNPLKEELKNVCGDFSSEKDCKQAAAKVVQHMQKLQSDIDRDRQKRAAVEKEAETAKKTKEDEARKTVQNEKKKHKDDAKKRNAENAVKNFKDSDAARKNKKDEKFSKNKFDKEKCHQDWKLLGFFQKLFTFLFKLVIWTVLLVTCVSFVLMLNCSLNHDGAFLPNSKELCNDLLHFATTGRLKVTWDYRSSWNKTLTSSKHVLDTVVDEMKNFDFVTWKKWAVQGLTDAQTKMAPILQSAMEQTGYILSWTAHFIMIWAKVTLQTVLIVADYVGQISIQAFDWVVKNGRHSIDNYPAYWERIKFYWYNTK